MASESPSWRWMPGSDSSTALAGIEDPEKKRHVIGHVFIDVFKDEAAKFPDAHFLAQGTLYPDVIESVSVKGPSAVIKSHHNVGGLPEQLGFELVEPLRFLFKDEVRQLGRELGLPEEFIGRHPFPGSRSRGAYPGGGQCGAGGAPPGGGRHLLERAPRGRLLRAHLPGLRRPACR